MHLRTLGFLCTAVPALACLAVPSSPPALPTEIPGSLVASACSQVMSFDDDSGPIDLKIVTATDPHPSGFALFGVLMLCQPEPHTPEDFVSCEHLAATLDKQLKSIPVRTPPDGEICHWAQLPPGQPLPENELVFRFSSPIPAASSPCGEAGLLLVVQLKGAFGGEWYWVPLEHAGGDWFAGEVKMLDIHD